MPESLRNLPAVLKLRPEDGSLYRRDDAVMDGGPAYGKSPLTYRDAGVDIDKASGSLDAIRRMAQSTLGPGQTSGEIGHFGGVLRLDAGPDRYLVASADGVGTKLKLAFVLGGEAHRQVGADLVNHCVNDILACGARPLFFLDYVGMGALDVEVLELLVDGLSSACRDNGLALIGGETAEMPGVYSSGEYDLAGFIVGEVDPSRFVSGSQIQEGDLLIGYASSGLHTNGYSLARAAFGLNGDPTHDRQVLDQQLRGTETTIGAALMAPHCSYQSRIRPLLEREIVRGMAHITGGGLIDNLPRSLPAGLSAEVELSAWTPSPIFFEIVERSRLPLRERYRVFNMGIGCVIVIRAADLETVMAMTPDAILIGKVCAHAERYDERVKLIGNH
ncbi:phosphoribosylformylglycinamidine cyclo-ligase [soil metagenome]